MSGYKEFEGKTLDEAIREACAFYDAARDKLEIEILNDAKGGIFGLVGARKARVKARLVELSSVFEELDSLGDKGKQPRKKPDSHEAGNRRGGRREPRDDAPRRERPHKDPDLPVSSPAGEEAGGGSVIPEQAALAQPSDGDQPAGADGAARPAKHARPARKGHAPAAGRATAAGRAKAAGRGAGGAASGERAHGGPDAEAPDMDIDPDEFSRVSFDQLDAAELERVTREIVSRMTEPFLGQVNIGVAIGNDRVKVSLSDIEDPGLLIGRDGQTLASLQYLVTRMLSNRMKALLRVQIDAGDYRERQDERLREMALHLAEKVKAGGRPQVTRPLSSYHRRVIHLTLQDDPLVQTHSKGEGEMKRVMVARRKPS